MASQYAKSLADVRGLDAISESGLKLPGWVLKKLDAGHIKQMKYDFEQRLRESRDEAKGLDAHLAFDRIAAQKKVLEAIAAYERGEKFTVGNEYTVSLDAEPNQLLDWDTPFSDQPKQVRDAWAKAYEKVYGRLPTPNDSMTGYKAYEMLTGGARNYGGEQADAILRERSRILAENGLVGIRYLDQGSRGLVVEREFASDPKSAWVVSDSDRKILFKSQDRNGAQAFADKQRTRNYVIWDDSKIKITHKNGQEITAREALKQPEAIAAGEPVTGEGEDLSPVDLWASYRASIQNISAFDRQIIPELQRLGATLDQAKAFKNGIFRRWRAGDPEPPVSAYLRNALETSTGAQGVALIEKFKNEVGKNNALFERTKSVPAPPQSEIDERIAQMRTQPKISPGEPVTGEPEIPEEAPTQVAGEKIGEFRRVEKIDRIRDSVQTVYFNGTQPVSPERTTQAWELARRFTNPDSKGSFAEEVARSSSALMGPGMLRNELWDYATRMALNKDPRLLQFMTLRSQDFQTISPDAYKAFGVGGDTQSALVLRAAAERANGGLWKRMVTYTKEQLNFLGRKFAKGPEGLQQIIDAVSNLGDSINPDDLEQAIRTGVDKNGRTIQDIMDLGSEERKAAEEIAGGPGLPPERKSTILETVYEWMKNPVSDADKESFIAGLKSRLMEPDLRLNDEQAQTIADQTWNRKRYIVGEQTKRLLDAELRRLDNLAENTAQGFIRRFNLAEWVKPEKPNEVRDIIKEALKAVGPVESGGLLKDVLEFRKDLRAKLIEAGLTPDTAGKVADAVSEQRDTELTNAAMKARQQAAKSKNIRSLVESILSTPYLEQGPEWRKETARNWFMSNGLSRESATEAAKQFDAQFRIAMERAAEEAADRLTKNGTIKDPRTVKELVSAIRLGMADPKSNWIDVMSNKFGFKSLTAEQQQRLAELEQKLAGKEITTPEQVMIVEQMMGIMRHVGDPDGHLMKFIGESFAASLLSGIRTLTLHMFQPMVNTLGSMATHGLAEPRDLPMLTRALWEASKSWWPELKFAWQKDAYSFNAEQMALYHNELKRQFEIATTEFKNKQYLKAIPRITFAWQQYVIRALQSANQAGMAVVQKWKLALYGSIAMRAAGKFTTADISEIVDHMVG